MIKAKLAPVHTPVHTRVGNSWPYTILSQQQTRVYESYNQTVLFIQFFGCFYLFCVIVPKSMVLFEPPFICNVGEDKFSLTIHSFSTTGWLFMGFYTTVADCIFFQALPIYFCSSTVLNITKFNNKH